MNDFMDSKEIAERLNVGVRHVQRLAREGRIPHTRNGRSIRVPRAAWEVYIAAQTEAALAALKERVRDQATREPAEGC